MKESTGFYLPPNRKNDQRELFYRLFLPENEVKATILVLHGMQEHSGRYIPLCQFLCENGFAVLSYDHLGHGKTAKTEKDYGFFRKENPAQLLVDDAQEMGAFLAEKFPNLPHFALGHSMGSFILRLMLRQASKD